MCEIVCACVYVALLEGQLHRRTVVVIYLVVVYTNRQLQQQCLGCLSVIKGLVLACMYVFLTMFLFNVRSGLTGVNTDYVVIIIIVPSLSYVCGHNHSTRVWSTLAQRHQNFSPQRAITMTIYNH